MDIDPNVKNGKILQFPRVRQKKRDLQGTLLIMGELVLGGIATYFLYQLARHHNSDKGDTKETTPARR